MPATEERDTCKRGECRRPESGDIRLNQAQDKQENIIAGL